MKYALMDLHLHLDGSLSPDSVKELAAMQGIAVPGEEELLKLLRVAPDCRSLNEYLEKFDFPLSLLQTQQAITASVRNLCRELREQGLLYAEIRFAPQLHCRKGLSQREVVEAAVAGLPEAGFRAGLILCCMRGSGNEEANRETVLLAPDYLGRGVCAVDLAGAEALFPTADYEGLFALVRELGLPYTIHAGEADGPESIRCALSFGTRRLGHGVRSFEDEALLDRLAKEDILLELCPSSNLHTCIFSELSQYPIRRFLEKGVKFSLNTDNMTVSGTSLAREWERIAKTFSLSEAELQSIARNSAAASFADADTKKMLLEHIGKL